jgi:signal transduction histidine kinase/CheY-like chemotaxis protein
MCFAALLIYALAMCFVHFYYRRKCDVYREQMRQKELSNALEAAEAASRAKSEFLRRMSHDIRTPINGIIGMTNIARKNLENPVRMEDCLHKIEDSSQHLCLLVNDVLDMSRIESGTVDNSQCPFDIMAVAEKCSSIIRGQLNGKTVEFVTDFSGIIHTKLVGTVVNLERIIINILGNSVKFTHEGGKISFCITEAKLVEKICDKDKMEDVSQNEKTAIFCFLFEDTGIGMSKDFLPTIFDEFSQDIEQSRTNYQGTGLGMAITKKYVDMLGGKIEVESEQHVGTKFRVEIPFTLDQGIEENNEQGINDFSLAGRKVLLVEDNELNAEIAAEIMQGEGADITIAQNGKMAVEVYARSEEKYFDLILMDIMMPEMDGITATTIIRDMNRADAKTVPIVAMTANAFEEDREVAETAGMNGYVMKPIDVPNLKKILKDVLKDVE